MALVSDLLKLLVGLLLCFKLGETYVQELVLHERLEEDGNFYTFRTPVADTSGYPLANIKRVCVTGWWIVYKGPHFETLGEMNELFAHLPNSTMCRNMSFPFYSFRHGASNETDIEAISLYTEYYYGGEEIFITHSPYGGITFPIKSLGHTGPSTSRWTIFEGKNFDGASLCLDAINWGDHHGHQNLTAQLGLQTVGSVIKGCDLDENYLNQLRDSFVP